MHLWKKYETSLFQAITNLNNLKRVQTHYRSDGQAFCDYDGRKYFVNSPEILAGVGMFLRNAPKIIHRHFFRQLG